MEKEICDEGVINLSIAVINNARQEYQAHLNVCNDYQARISAITDAKGLVGHILEYCTGDRYFMLKEIEKKISS